LYKKHHLKDKNLASPISKENCKKRNSIITSKRFRENGRITKSDVENFTPASSPQIVDSKPQERSSKIRTSCGSRKPYVPAAGQFATEEIKKFANA
jgi:pyruvate dehydrogenase E2 component (dihydrolipoamide acetyltransferase)